MTPSRTKEKTELKDTRRIKKKSPSAKKAAPENEEEPSLVFQIVSLAEKAVRMAVSLGGTSAKVGKALFMASSGDSEMMKETGAYLKDIRELAGLTRDELTHALHLSDQSLLEAVENGTATLSFELILRLAALLARHDPVPFIIRVTRTYDPEIWNMLEKWGIGRIPLHFERERLFINIYRGHDAARQLSDEGFARVLAFTRAAFEMALHFVDEQELKGPAAGRRKKSTPAQSAADQQGTAE